MIHINILSRSGRLFYPHWDKKKFPPSEFDIRENSEEDLEWDCVVVYQNIVKEKTFRCKTGRVIYFSGEPPMMFPCPSVFTSQFDFVVLPHPHVRHQHKVLSHGFLNWSLGYGYYSHQHRYNYQQLSNLNPQKTKLFSIVTSNQKMMPGHNKRMRIIEKLRNDYPNMIDIYGKGFNTVDFKADALEPYMFHICIENSSIENYWTEKIADPILAQCVPIYAGCTNVSNYLGNKGYFQFNVNDYDSLRNIIDSILESPNEVYMNLKSDLNHLRKIIMEEQNLIPFVIKMVKEGENSRDVKNYTIKPLESSWQYSLQILKIRLNRLVYKTWFNIQKM